MAGAGGILGTVLGDYILPTFLGGLDAPKLVALQQTLTKIDSLLPKDINIDAEDFGPFGSITYWDKTYKAIRDTNQLLGISGKLAKNIEFVTKDALANIEGLGGTVNDITAANKAFSESSSTNRLLSNDDVSRLTKMRLAFGEGFEEIFASAALYGASIENTNKSIEASFIKANKLGLNAAKTVKALRDNFNLIDKLTFRSGIDGLSKMVMLSERYKFNMSGASAAVENLTTLEGAMTVSAQLQTLGGDFGQLSDPISLMFESRNNPDKLIEKVIKLAGAYAYLDEKQGQFVIDPYAMDQIKEFSKIFGQASDEVVRFSKIQAKEQKINLDINPALKSLGNYEEILGKISTNAFFNQKTKSFGINIADQSGEIIFRQVKDIQETDLKSVQSVQDETDPYRDLIMSNDSLIDSINRLIKSLKREVISDNIYQAANNLVQPIADDTRNNLASDPSVQRFKKWFNDASQNIADFSTAKYLNRNSQSLEMDKIPRDVEEMSISSPILSKNWSKASDVNTSSYNINESPNRNATNENLSKIDFGDISGTIELKMDGTNVGEIDMDNVMGKIMPSIKTMIIQQIYNETDNRTKDNPKTGNLHK